jgi:diguanylate cyclase (GGDEF)-like protein
MEDETRILTAAPRPAVSGPARNACLVHIYPSGPSLGRRYPLGETPLLLGRDESCCGICINDDSVSRRHACIQPTAHGFSVQDLQSTNGTFVNDARIALHILRDGDYLRIGNGIYRFLAGGNVEAEYHEEIYRLAIIDALTEAHNKRYFLDFLSRQLSLSTRYRRPLALAILDLDRFKAINDEMGHLCGDYTLRELAGRIKKVVRKDDLFARYGGEEFALVMPETMREDALHVGEQIRRMIENNPFQYGGLQYQITTSIGIAAITGEEWLAPSEMIRLADENLYQAKHQGRNRVVG